MFELDYVWIMHIGLFQKKNLTRGVEDMEFPGVLKKEHVEIPGVS